MGCETEDGETGREGIVQEEFGIWGDVGVGWLDVGEEVTWRRAGRGIVGSDAEIESGVDGGIGRGWKVDGMEVVIGPEETGECGVESKVCFGADWGDLWSRSIEGAVERSVYV